MGRKKKLNIIRGTDLGFRAQAQYIRADCVDCGKERWVMSLHGQAKNLRCRSCGAKHRQAKRDDKRNDYRDVKVLPSDFFFPMVHKDGRVLEHRLVMAKHLGRLLLPQEVVHHKNGVKNDNRLDNLALISNQAVHDKLSICNRCELKKEIRLLRWQIKEILGNPDKRLL